MATTKMDQGETQRSKGRFALASETMIQWISRQTAFERLRWFGVQENSGLSMAEEIGVLIPCFVDFPLNNGLLKGLHHV